MKLIKQWLTYCGGLILAASGIAAYAGPSLVQCNGIKDLVFVAHQDDDLLFMNPDIASSIQAGGCVQVVYLTASERGEGEGYMLGRERGVRAAYSYMAQEPNIWAEDFATVGSRRLARFTLHGNKRLQLLHMRLKDPWLGKGWGSLTPLSRTESVAGATAESLGPAIEIYSRSELVATIEDIIRDYQPSTIRRMDDSISIPYDRLCWRCAGHAHPDHIASARLVHDAIVNQPGNYAEIAYIDYPSQERVANLSATEISEKSQAFRRYAWDDYRYCANARLCQEPAGPAAAWVGRAYYVSRNNEAPYLLSRLDGGFFLFVLGEANAGANAWQSAGRRWVSLGGRTADPIAPFRNSDGRAGVFARDATGLAWVSARTAAGGWTSWQSIPGVRLTSLPVVSAKGPLIAVAMGNNGLLQYSRPVKDTHAWTPWHALPPLPGALGRPALASDLAGATMVFASDVAGRLWHSVYRTRWSPWQRINVPPTDGGLAAVQNANGIIELYLRDMASGHLLRISQQPEGGSTTGWSPPTDLGLAYVGSPAVGLNETGAVAVAVLERHGGPLWLVESGHATRVAATAGSLPALQAIGGALYVGARSLDKSQAYWVKARRHGVWQEPLLIDAPPAAGGGAFRTDYYAGTSPIKPLPSRYAELAPRSLAVLTGDAIAVPGKPSP